ncbi:metallophosphoesterase [Paenibacillus sp. TH7-28]
MRGRRDMVWLVIVGLLLAAAIFGLQKIERHQAAQPKSVALTFKGDARNSLAFTWYTETPGLQGIVQVAEGTQPPVSWEGERIFTFAAESAEIVTGNGKRQGVHKAEATGLVPGMAYVYRLGSGRDGGWSEPAGFVTEAAKPEMFSFINVADSQGETEADFKLWGRTLDKAFAVFPDARFIVHNGDLTEEPENEQGWDAFFGQAGQWLKRVPLLPVTGNHDEIAGEAERFTSHFNLPDNGAKGSAPGTTYSFDYGHAHFVMLDTESNLKRQADWLRDDLQKNGKPWTIVAMHRPAYGGNQYEKAEEWIKIFDEYGVDLVLQGHNHEYSRSYPLRSGEIVPAGEGTVYVVTNTAGPKFNELKKDKFYHAVHFQNDKQMFAGITVSERSLRYEAYDADGNKLDEVVLTR